MCVQSLKFFLVSSLAHVLLPSPLTLPIFPFISVFHIFLFLPSLFHLPQSLLPLDLPPSPCSLIPPFSTTTTHLLPSMLPHLPSLLHAHLHSLPPSPPPSQHKEYTRSTVSWTLKMRRTESPEVKIWPGACGQWGNGLVPTLTWSPQLVVCAFPLLNEVLHKHRHKHAHTLTHFSSIWLASKKYLEHFLMYTLPLFILYTYILLLNGYLSDIVRVCTCNLYIDTNVLVLRGPCACMCVYMPFITTLCTHQAVHIDMQADMWVWWAWSANDVQVCMQPTHQLLQIVQEMKMK